MKENKTEKWSKDSKERDAGSRDHENTPVSRISANEKRETYFKRWRRRRRKKKKKQLT